MYLSMNTLSYRSNGETRAMKERQICGAAEKVDCRSRYAGLESTGGVHHLIDQRGAFETDYWSLH